MREFGSPAVPFTLLVVDVIWPKVELIAPVDMRLAGPGVAAWLPIVGVGGGIVGGGGGREPATQFHNWGS